MDKKRIQAHGIAAGGVVDDLIPDSKRSAVHDLKEPVVLHAGSAADPLGLLTRPYAAVAAVLNMMGIYVSCNERVQVDAAAVRDDKLDRKSVV